MRQGITKSDMKDFRQDCVENAQSMTPVGALILRKHLPNAVNLARPKQALSLNIPGREPEHEPPFTPPLSSPSLRQAESENRTESITIIAEKEMYN